MLHATSSAAALGMGMKRPCTVKGEKREAVAGQTKVILQLYGIQKCMGETKEAPEPIFPPTKLSGL